MFFWAAWPRFKAGVLTIERVSTVQIGQGQLCPSYSRFGLGRPDSSSGRSVNFFLKAPWLPRERGGQRKVGVGF